MSYNRNNKEKKPIERPGLSKEEIVELEEAFKLFDTNNTGYINVKELKNAMDSLGFKNKSLMVYSMIERVNADSLNFEQFLDLMTARIADTDSRDDIKKVFLLFSDGSDYITIDNLIRITQELNEPLHIEEIREMVARADINQDNRIDFDEFYAIMTNKHFH